MNILEKTELELGYIPLLDCIALLWAEHKGYFNQYGLQVNLVKETSWASLRDRLAFGFLDAAHCLSAMLPAAAAGHSHLPVVLKAPLVLSQNRAFISLSQQLCYALDIHPQDSVQQSSAKVVNAIQQGKSIQFAHVFQQSIHHYLLREWLALTDPDLAKHIRFSALPPPDMVKAISTQQIDGFCVGEPWNIQAQVEGYSHVVADSQNLIPHNIPDKVLAITAQWEQQYPNTLKALIQAIELAQQDLKNKAYFSEIWQLLQRHQIIRFECSERIHVSAYYKVQNIIENLAQPPLPMFSGFEWISHKMNQWEQLSLSDSALEAITQSCLTQQ